MPKYYCTCLYCNHKFEEYIYSQYNNSVVCPKCKDKNIKMKPEEDKLNYYKNNKEEG